MPQARSGVRRVEQDGALAVVAAAFGVVQVILGPARLGLGWDETVYVSQVTARIPAAAFTAPRARGVSVLVAPIASWTSSQDALRAYLVVASIVGLFSAFRVWVPLLGGAPVVLAAGLFGSLWVSMIYGSEAMPNFWLALCLVAAAGFATRAAGTARTLDYVGLAGTLVGAAVLRPSDAVWFSLALLILLAHRVRRRVTLAGVSVAALIAGVLPWVVEADVRFGGLAARLRASGSVQGGLSPQPGAVYEARALYGPMLCRPCGHATHALGLDLWWFALPVFVVLAVFSARHRDRFWPLLVAATGAALVALPYLTLVGYAAPRFLLPAYALAALPVADGALRLAGRQRSSRLAHGWLWAASAACAFFVAGQLVAGYRQFVIQQPSRLDYARIADQLHGLGVRSPCTVHGRDAPPIAFYTGCASTTTSTRATAADHPAKPCRGHLAVVIRAGDRRPAYTHDWPAHRLHGLADAKPWTAYLAVPCSG